MRIENLIEEKKADIVQGWFKLVAETYPDDTAHFLKNQKDPFANPVGSNILKGLTGLMDHLLKESDSKIIVEFLDPIIRIRAIQKMFTPSQATAFIFDLKIIIRKSLKKEVEDLKIKDELWTFESRIDRLALTAFDLFMECREQIFELRANQEKNRVYKAFERAGLIAEIQ
jgi:hypothetical protein